MLWAYAACVSYQIHGQGNAVVLGRRLIGGEEPREISKARARFVSSEAMVRYSAAGLSQFESPKRWSERTHALMFRRCCCTRLQAYCDARAQRECQNARALFCVRGDCFERERRVKWARLCGENKRRPHHQQQTRATTRGRSERS